MADEKTSKMKGKWGLVVKLIAGVGALTGAVERYIDLQEKNELVYEALASKVNNMSEELAEMKGQQQVMMVFLARRDGLDLGPGVMGSPAPASDVVEPADEAGDEAGEEAAAEGDVEPASAEFSGETEVVTEVAEPTPPKRPKPRLNIQAYENLPASVDDLVQQKAK